jgi:hypothetical protein
MTNNKTSLLVSSQLPEFIRDDASYQNFVLFLEAYYEWLEQSGNVSDVSKNILNYGDIDNTTDQFLDYFYNDFLPYFPKEILADKVKVTKIAKELYKTKGTPASYKFLFKILYNTDVDFFFTKDAVLKASSGKWYIAKSLKLASNDPNLLNINNLRIFGETTKSIATVENSVLSGIKTEVFISNIERLFQSGEYIRVVDSNNQDVLFDGQPLRAKVVGQISQITIDSKNRGNYYQSGDPVIVYDGLNSPTGHGATAAVGATTTGSIQRITVNTDGYGYTLTTANTQTLIDIVGVSGALAAPGSFNPAANGIANVSLIPIDYIGKKRYITIGNTNYNFANNITSNANTSLANAFNFTAFSTYPISSVIVQNGGGAIASAPTITAESTYKTEDNAAFADLKRLGILAPIQIANAGTGYVANDKINIVGGLGYGAMANVTSVAANGAILSVAYVYKTNEFPHHHPLGGMGYSATGLPTLSVTSANVLASNASLYVPGILGDGATFSSITDRVGTITTINVIDPGEDYTSTPNVSIKVQDIIVSNVSINPIAQNGDIAYQGTSFANSTYRATVSSINQVYSFANTQQTLYNLRVYDYNSLPNYSLPIKIYSKSISLNMSNQYPTLNTAATRYDSTGVITYGDGSAKANASFLNGLVVSQGQYLDTSGQPSSFDVLQSTDFNNYTYEITLEKEIEKYRSTLINLLHPAGMKAIGRYAMKSNSSFNFEAVDALNIGRTLGFYTGSEGSSVSMLGDFGRPSTNIVLFNNLAGAPLTSFLFQGDTLNFVTSNGISVSAEVLSVFSYVDDLLIELGLEDLVLESGTQDLLIDSNDYAILKDNVWLSFANVANVTANASSNTINITSLTNSYNIVNNGVYSNTMYPLMDIVHAGDIILVANNAQANVASVDYVNSIIKLKEPLANSVNSLLSVSRTLYAFDGNVTIFGPVGIQYFPEITTESGDSIITEDGNFILLG